MLLTRFGHDGTQNFQCPVTQIRILLYIKEMYEHLWYFSLKHHTLPISELFLHEIVLEFPIREVLSRLKLFDCFVIVFRDEPFKDYIENAEQDDFVVYSFKTFECLQQAPDKPNPTNSIFYELGLYQLIDKIMNFLNTVSHMTIFEEPGDEELEVHINGFGQIFLGHTRVFGKVLWVVYAAIVIMCYNVVLLEPIIHRTL